MIRSGLYIIVRANPGNPLFLNYSSKYGTGWNPYKPKQAFAQCELVEMLQLLEKQGLTSGGITIIELQVENFVTVKAVPIDFENHDSHK